MSAREDFLCVAGKARGGTSAMRDLDAEFRFVAELVQHHG